MPKKNKSQNNSVDRKSDGETIFDNNFINQLFLLKHWSLEFGGAMTHRFENGHEVQIAVPFKEYVSTLGIED